MTGCIRAPQSLADADAILVACAGPHWRDSFMLGLEPVIAIVALIVAAVAIYAVLLAKWMGPDPGIGERRAP